MLIVAGNETRPESVTSQYPATEIEMKVLETLSSGNGTYRYSSMDELKFELEMRKRIIEASRDLYRGGLRFKVFRESECNERYWNRTEEGGFEVKEGVRPSEAMTDIFEHTRRYGTECATAVVIVFYKAVLDIYQADLFDRNFEGLYLMNWQNAYKQLGVLTYRDAEDFFPGDCRYFANPDVDPLTPEWQGENAIDMGNGKYYGHGIGIVSGELIIEALNRNRISGSETSAYLMETATRPDFKKLSGAYVPVQTTT